MVQNIFLPPTVLYVPKKTSGRPSPDAGPAQAACLAAGGGQGRRLPRPGVGRWGDRALRRPLRA
eukprot:7205169-Lingulodinium_polyedra.AAC.1